jgi:hypothetical protein
MTMMRSLVLLALLAFRSAAFQPGKSLMIRIPTAVHGSGDEESSEGWNPLKDFNDMLSNFDDVIDDFMGKRMGNGELFYGKRQFNPSGRDSTDGQYNGMGMSDKHRIDVARERKELFLEQRRRQAEEGKKS